MFTYNNQVNCTFAMIVKEIIRLKTMARQVYAFTEFDKVSDELKSVINGGRTVTELRGEMGTEILVLVN